MLKADPNPSKVNFLPLEPASHHMVPAPLVFATKLSCHADKLHEPVVYCKPQNGGEKVLNTKLKCQMYRRDPNPDRRDPNPDNPTFPPFPAKRMSLSLVKVFVLFMLLTPLPLPHARIN